MPDSQESSEQSSWGLPSWPRWSSPPRCCCGASALPGPCPGSGQSWWTHPWASVVVDYLHVRGNGRPCCWRGAAWAWPRRRAGTWPRVSSSVLQGGEVEEVAGLRDRAAAGTCSRRIQITKVLFTHGHESCRMTKAVFRVFLLIVMSNMRIRSPKFVNL